MVHLEKKIKEIMKTKRKKLEKLTSNEYLRKLVKAHFNGLLDLFTIPKDFSNYCENFCRNVINLVNSVSLISSTRSSLEASNNNSNIHDKEEVNLCYSVSDRLSNAASLEDNRYKANFVSSNVINLSKRKLTKDEISRLSKVLKFVPTS